MVQCTSNMMQNMAWYARCDMQCICVLRKEKKDQGINLANQVCRWKDEMISVEIDIKITGNGCTVCKWQEKQEWHNSAINSMTPSGMQQETKLLHSKKATKHMELTKHAHWATAKSRKSRFKQAWQECKRYQHHSLSESSNMQGNNIRKPCLEQANNMLREHIRAKQGTTWIF